MRTCSYFHKQDISQGANQKMNLSKVIDKYRSPRQITN